MTDTVWLNGEVIDPESPAISVFDHGFTVGDGLFETLRTVGGAPFALRRHLARLRRSAAGVQLDIGLDDGALRRAVHETLEAAGHDEARVRITVTGGVGPSGSQRGDGPATVVVSVGPLLRAPPTTEVCVVPWCRNDRGAVAGLKTTSYAENVVALQHARARGCTEALLANTRDELCEGTGSNVFVVLDGTAATPPLSSGCLAGVTRELLIEATGVVERPVPMAELADAEEVFLTSSTRDVQAVTAIDGRPVGPGHPGAPGPVTAAAAEAFAAVLAGDPDPPS